MYLVDKYLRQSGLIESIIICTWVNISKHYMKESKVKKSKNVTAAKNFRRSCYNRNRESP